MLLKGARLILFNERFDTTADCGRTYRIITEVSESERVLIASSITSVEDIMYSNMEDIWSHYEEKKELIKSGLKGKYKSRLYENAEEEFKSYI